MPLHRSNPALSSLPSESEVAACALVPDAPDHQHHSSHSAKRSIALTSSVVLKKESSLSLSASKASRKRGGMGGPTKSTESAFSSLLQPILALFPPAQSPSPLAPAFELKLPNPPKSTTDKQASQISDVKAKTLTHADDEDAFVIYQPASWSAKRTKQTAARIAYTFDWRTDVFGPSPDAVHGQRTKYPKPAVPVPPRREAGRPIQQSVLLRNLMRDRAGSSTSVSDVSSVSFASTLEEGVESYPITPLLDQVSAEIAVPAQGNASVPLDPEDDVSPSALLASPTGAVAERLSKMVMVSPRTAAPFQENPGAQALDKNEEVLHTGSTPYTPRTPRSIPDSDEESDDD